MLVGVYPWRGTDALWLKFGTKKILVSRILEKNLYVLSCGTKLRFPSWNCSKITNMLSYVCQISTLRLVQQQTLKPCDSIISIAILVFLLQSFRNVWKVAFGIWFKWPCIVVQSTKCFYLKLIAFNYLFLIFIPCSSLLFAENVETNFIFVKT